MKKLIVALILILALTAGVVTFKNLEDKKGEGSDAQNAIAETLGQTEDEEASEAEAIQLQTIDYDALYASCNPEDIVMKVDDREVTWDEYYYWLEYFGQTAEYYMYMYSYYGYEVSWEDYAPTIKENAENQIKSFIAIEKFAEENGVEVTEEQAAEIEEGIAEAVTEQYGEDTEENRNAYFESLGVSAQLYSDFTNINYLYQNSFDAVYGEDSSNVSDEEALKWLEENEYMYASHILFATLDLGTMEDLSDEEKAEKEAQAKKVAEELQAIKDSDELLARFKELKEEYCEDSGKEAYPDGYMFLTGDMVEEFENGYKALADYEVSDPILSAYGYHVMLRLPLDPDAIMEYSDENEPLTARQEYANSQYGVQMDEYTNAIPTEVYEQVTGLNLMEYLVD